GGMRGDSCTVRSRATVVSQILLHTPHRQPRPEVAGALATGAVLAKAPGDVGGDSGVEGAVGALDHVHAPVQGRSATARRVSPQARQRYWAAPLSMRRWRWELSSWYRQAHW